MKKIITSISLILSKNYFELGANLTYVSALDNGQEADSDNNLADT